MSEFKDPLSIIRLTIIFFFFSSRRRHTRCGRDWSSDVCSSDLESWDRGRDQEQYDGDPEVPPIRSDKSQESPIHRDRGSLLRGVAALAPHEHVDAPAAAHPDHSLLPATEGGGSRMVRANEVSHDHLHVSRRRQGRSHTVPKYSIPLYPTRRAVVSFGLSAKSSGTRSASVRAVLETCL